MVINNEEIFIIEDFEDFDIIYVPLRSYLAKATKGIATKFDDAEFVGSFIKYIQKKPLYDIHLLNEKIHQILPELSIPITDNCNLRCKYCYACAGENNKVKSFTKEMLTSAIDAYFNFVNDCKEKYITNKNNRLRISLAGGGEPTIYPSLFQYAIDLCKQRAAEIGFNCVFSMPTNLTCDRQLLDYIIQNFSHLSVSFDGMDFIQNYHRPFANGAESFGVVFNNAKYLRDNNFGFSLRVTVTDYSVDYMPEIAEFFHENFPKSAISFEKMHVMGRSLISGINAPSDEYYNQKFMDLLEYAKQKQIPVKNASVNRFNSLRTTYCGAVGIPNWTITTDGRIVSCERDNLPAIFSFGKFDFNESKFIIDEKKLNAIRELNVFNFPECADCFCKYNCGGDCPDLRMIDGINCSLIRSIGATALKEKLEA